LRIVATLCNYSARLEAERQALAILDHTGIAHVREAGTTENDWPDSVIEHVSGMFLTGHCK
jgi:Holliday junction resolvase